MNQIYINTKQNEETRVIAVENNKLTGYEQERPGQENKKGNIYKGVVTRLQDSLEAAFVDLGDEKNGFLPLKELPEGRGNLKVGDNVLVQIKKDHVGGKGAGLTGNISLAGCYLVLQPNRSNRTMISKHCDRDTREQMQTIIQNLPVPEGMSIILRTAGGGRTEEELRWDLESYLLKLWGLIDAANEQTTNEPMLIYGENNLPLRVVRDYFRPSRNDEIICDDPEIYQELKQLIAIMYPDCEDKIRYHDSNDDMVPSIIENQIDQIFERDVVTKSGVRVVFDSTEALVAIDVNSGSSHGGGDIEETALTTNMEAAEVIALHLRLRNLAGLIVVDFIDMEKEKNRLQVERHFSQFLRQDRARTRHTRISEFGLVEVSRQRISRSLVSSQQLPCNQCNGTGIAWRPETFAIRLLRKIRVIAADDGVVALLVQAPAQTAVYLLNEKRIEIRKIEDACNCDILIAPNESMHPPQYDVKTIKGGARIEDSYKIIHEQENEKLEGLRAQFNMRQQSPQQMPLLKTMLPEKRAPQKRNGLLQRIKTVLGVDSSSKPSTKPPEQQPSASADKSSPPRQSSGRRPPRTDDNKRPPRRPQDGSQRRSAGGGAGGNRRPPRQPRPEGGRSEGGRSEGGRSEGGRSEGGRYEGGRNQAPRQSRPEQSRPQSAPQQGSQPSDQHRSETVEPTRQQGQAPQPQQQTQSPQQSQGQAPQQQAKPPQSVSAPAASPSPTQPRRPPTPKPPSDFQQVKTKAAPKSASAPASAPAASAPVESKSKNGNPTKKSTSSGGGDLPPAMPGDKPPTSGWIDTKND